MSLKKNWKWLSLPAILFTSAMLYLRTTTCIMGPDFQVLLSCQNASEFNWLDFFHHNYWYPLFPNLNEYRPLTLLSFWIQVKLGFHENEHMHLVNICLHLLCISALFFLIKKLFGSTNAALSALIFSIHPIFSEAIILGVGRADLCSTLLALLAWRVYLGQEQGILSKRPFRLFFSCFFVFCSILFKESGAAIVGVIMLGDYLGIHHRMRTSSIKAHFIGSISDHIYFLLTFILYLLFRVGLGVGYTFQTSSYIDNPLVLWSYHIRILTAAWVMLRGILLFFLPLNLSSDYSYNQIPPLDHYSDYRLWFVVLFLVATMVIVKWAIVRRKMRVIWLIGSYFSLYFIVSNFVLLIGTIMAERTLYLPGTIVVVGLSLLVHFFYRMKRKSTLLFVPLLLIALSVRTVYRINDWSTYDRYLTSLEKTAPDSYRTQIKIAKKCLINGHLSKAKAKLDAMDKKYYAIPNCAWFHGQISIAQNNSEEALLHFCNALNKGYRTTAEVHRALETFIKTRQFDCAEELLRVAIQQQIPNWGEYFGTYVQVAIASGCIERSLAFCLQWSKNTDSGKPIRLAAQILNKVDPQSVEPFLVEQIEQDHHRAQAILLLSELYGSQGRTTESLYLLHVLSNDFASHIQYRELARKKISKITP